MNRFNVLARLFRRTDNEVISALYSHALNRPLMVEPAIGEALLGAYMAGAVEYDGNRAPVTAGQIAVMNISGALASRPMPGPSGEGPMNYEQMSATFDALVQDDAVSAIVLRMDTPGGFAAGLFDFTDRIYEARGTKPIHAVVDDMAYSAGYAIAAAADTVWVTRTAGVGSVGVVAYHVDKSEANAKEGLKVTAIYAGAQKVDFSPHFPLSEEAMAREQVHVDELYSMFVGSVARYRGLSDTAVRATEAGVFHGAAAVEAGFADRIGTFEAAIAHLSGESAQEDSVRMEDEAMTEAATRREELRALGGVAQAVLAADLPPHVALALLRSEVREEDVEARIEHARKVLEVCGLAKIEAKAEAYVAGNTPIDEVRADLLEKKASAEAEIVTALPTAGGLGGKAPGLWDKTILKFGGKPQ